MNYDPSTGYEIQKETPELVTVIGREMPKARDLYEFLSDKKDILVYSDATSDIRKGSETAIKSERELFDDLLDFCERCRDLPTDENDSHGYVNAIRNVDTFLDSMTYLSKDMYSEATHGLAARHSAWLSENPDKKLLFAIPDSRKEKSQGLVVKDIATKIEYDVLDRTDVAYLSEMTADMIDGDTKVVLCDDWSVSGNHIANDLANVLQRAQALNIDPRGLEIEINLLLARADQVKDGIHTIPRFREDFPEMISKEPKIVAYFKAPVSKLIFDEQASPTGSHSAADYGFSQTLSRMLMVASRRNAATRMPYIATIIQEYNHKHIDK